jgi:hypothetical protein
MVQFEEVSVLLRKASSHRRPLFNFPSLTLERVARNLINWGYWKSNLVLINCRLEKVEGMVNTQKLRAVDEYFHRWECHISRPISRPIVRLQHNLSPYLPRQLSVCTPRAPDFGLSVAFSSGRALIFPCLIRDRCELRRQGLNKGTPCPQPPIFPIRAGNFSLVWMLSLHMRTMSKEHMISCEALLNGSRQAG